MYIHVYLREMDQTLVKEFKEVARKEGGMSTLIRDFMVQYLREHGVDNPNYTLTNWVDQPSFLAMPTMGKILEPEVLDKASDEDLERLWRSARARKQEIEGAMRRRKWIIEE